MESESSTTNITLKPDSVEYRRLLTQHYRSLWRCARRLARNEHEAADILHDALVVILCHETGPSDTGRFAAWCRGVVRHVARRAWQRRRGQRSLPLEAAAQVCGLDDDSEIHCVRRDLIRRALGKVDAPAAQLLGRRYCLGESSQEIGADLQQSAAAVRMRLKRVLDACGATTRTVEDLSHGRFAKCQISQ